MRDLRVVVVAISVAISTMADAAPRSGMRFWNLTLYTLTSLQFSLPGKNEWGPNQCQNDNDGTVDHDERLSITGIVPGRYDAKLTTRPVALASSKTSSSRRAYSQSKKSN